MPWSFDVMIIRFFRSKTAWAYAVLNLKGTLGPCFNTLFPIMGVGSTFSNIFLVGFFIDNDYVIGNLVELLNLGLGNWKKI